MEKNCRRRRRLVLLPCPFQGHINTMLQLGTILHAHGFSITIVHAEFNSPDPSNHPNFNFLPIPDGLSEADISSGDPVTILWLINANCRSHLRECLSQMMTAPAREGPDDGDIACIIYDEFMYFSEAVANSLKLPSIILTTMSAATFLARTALIQLVADGQLPFQDSVLQDSVPELYPLRYRYKDLPIPLFGICDNFSKLVLEAYKIRTSSAIIWNTMDCLEPSSLSHIQHQFQVPILPLGPMHKFAPASSSSLWKEDTSCMEWLGKQTKHSVIYVSLGSIASMDEKQLAELAWGLASSQQPFLWVIRPGSVHGSEWIEILPEGFKENIGDRGCIVTWALQKEVLAHSAVGGFLSHCGWNSTLESISEGIPMICRPYFGDQRVNARYVSHVWKVGLELENEMERGEIKRAVRRVMVEKEGEAMRERAKNLKENIELCIKEDGSSNNALNRLVEMIMS